MEQVKRYELFRRTPVRVVYEDFGAYFCGTDLARLFGYKKPYDTIKYFCNKPTKILIPCKQSPKEHSRTLCFLDEKQTREFISHQFELKNFNYRKYDVDCFIMSLMSGLYPNILKPKVVPLTRGPNTWKKVRKNGCEKDGHYDYNPNDVQTAMTILKMIDELKEDASLFLSGKLFQKTKA